MHIYVQILFFLQQGILIHIWENGCFTANAGTSISQLISIIQTEKNEYKKDDYVCSLNDIAPYFSVLFFRRNYGFKYSCSSIDDYCSNIRRMVLVGG